MPDDANTPTDDAQAASPNPEAPQGIEALDPSWQAEIKRLRSEAASHRSRVRELEPLAQEAEKLREAQMTEQQKVEARAAQLEARATSAERVVAQYAAATKAGLPLDLAARLQGSTPEELEADAEKLKQLVAGGQRFEGRVNGGPRAPVPASDMNAFIRQIAGLG